MINETFKSAYNKIALSDAFKQEAKAKLAAEFSRTRTDSESIYSDKPQPAQNISLPEKRSSFLPLIAGLGAAALILVAIGIFSQSRGNITSPVTPSETDEATADVPLTNEPETAEPDGSDETDILYINEYGAGELRVQAAQTRIALNMNGIAMTWDSYKEAIDFTEQLTGNRNISLMWTKVLPKLPYNKESSHFSNGYFGDEPYATMVYESEEGTGVFINIGKDNTQFSFHRLESSAILDAPKAKSYLVSPRSYKNHDYITTEWVTLFISEYTENGRTYYRADWTTADSGEKLYYSISAKGITFDELTKVISMLLYGEEELRPYIGTALPNETAPIFGEARVISAEGGELRLNAGSHVNTYNGNIHVYAQNSGHYDFSEFSGLDNIERYSFPFDEDFSTVTTYSATYKEFDEYPELFYAGEPLPADDPEQHRDSMKFREMDYNQYSAYSIDTIPYFEDKTALCRTMNLQYFSENKTVSLTAIKGGLDYANINDGMAFFMCQPSSVFAEKENLTEIFCAEETGGSAYYYGGFANTQTNTYYFVTTVNLSEKEFFDVLCQVYSDLPISEQEYEQPTTETQSGAPTLIEYRHTFRDADIVLQGGTMFQPASTLPAPAKTTSFATANEAVNAALDLSRMEGFAIIGDTEGMTGREEDYYYRSWVIPTYKIIAENCSAGEDFVTLCYRDIANPNAEFIITAAVNSSDFSYVTTPQGEALICSGAGPLSKIASRETMNSTNYMNPEIYYALLSGANYGGTNYYYGGFKDSNDIQYCISAKDCDTETFLKVVAGISQGVSSFSEAGYYGNFITNECTEIETAHGTMVCNPFSYYGTGGGIMSDIVYSGEQTLYTIDDMIEFSGNDAISSLPIPFESHIEIPLCYYANYYELHDGYNIQLFRTGQMLETDTDPAAFEEAQKYFDEYYYFCDKTKYFEDKTPTMQKYSLAFGDGSSWASSTKHITIDVVRGDLRGSNHPFTTAFIPAKCSVGFAQENTEIPFYEYAPVYIAADNPDEPIIADDFIIGGFYSADGLCYEVRSQGITTDEFSDILAMLYKGAKTCDPSFESFYDLR